MNGKQWTGLVILLIGIAGLVYAIMGSARMSEARGDIKSTSSFVPDNKVKSYAVGRANAKVDSYKTPIALLYVGSGICIIVGGSLLVFGRSKSHK